ncbi:hypothetical protein TTHERM_00557950 (macronuclear) [Tetrahymena thermophila SB210]|uniref:Transmembrane protein n=1 Tax=Tetrahymena thermophila (strain SB210) TaxID=312017 RepID=I7LWL5_TETTS|nr:hypothetical protein TTHERM_00557950 [Tetrahymena thermophila SB210]EAS02114.1 hypothetical protein TTHERM_00557950 [Tetrahymena thermophila SB210]|eukprot:XP_001022359.1 hypothetical protein TTHERM_00557950 [Tetrahymena thermophila SB210]
MKFISLILIVLIASNSVNAASSQNNLSSCILSINSPCTASVVSSDPQCSANLAYYGVCIGACGVTDSISDYQNCTSSCSSSDPNLSSYVQSVQTCISKASGSHLIISVIILISIFILY